MKFGMNLQLWSGDVTEAMLPLLETLKVMGFDGVECPVYDLDPDKWARWGRRLDDMGLERTATTARWEQDNPISCDPAVRARGIEATKRSLDCAQALGAPILSGPTHSALGVFSGAGPTPEERQWGLDSMRAVAEHAGRTGVTLAVECLNRFENYLLTCHADAARFVREVDHPNCRLMYDTFHAHIEEKNTPEAIRACADVLVHVHISENDRSTPGRGNVRWAENFDTLHAVGYEGWMMIEAIELALPELAAATKIWRRMYESEEQLARDGLAFMRAEVAKRWR